MTSRAILKLCVVTIVIAAIGLISVFAFNYSSITHSLFSQKEPVSVSLDQLIADPAAFNKKEIVTKGYLRTLSNDGIENILCPNIYCKNNELISNSIRISLIDVQGDYIEIRKKKYSNLSKCNGNLILAEGLFLVENFPVLQSNIDKNIYNISSKPTLFIKRYKPCFPISDDK